MHLNVPCCAYYRGSKQGRPPALCVMSNYVILSNFQWKLMLFWRWTFSNCTWSWGLRYIEGHYIKVPYIEARLHLSRLRQERNVATHVKSQPEFAKYLPARQSYKWLIETVKTVMETKISQLTQPKASTLNLSIIIGNLWDRPTWIVWCQYSTPWSLTTQLPFQDIVPINMSQEA